MSDFENVRFLRPVEQSDNEIAEQTVGEMLDGWRNQMLARNLAFSTIAGRERIVQRLLADMNEFRSRWGMNTLPLPLFTQASRRTFGHSRSGEHWIRWARASST